MHPRITSASDRNISVWTLGQRCFGGLHSQATVNAITAPPLFDRPEFAPFAGAVAAFATFLFLIRMAARLRDEGDGFLVILSVSTVLNPIAWWIYLTLLFLPLGVVAHRLARRSWPPVASLEFGALVLMLVTLKIPQSLLLGGTNSAELRVSFLESLVTLVPVLWPLATAWVVVRSTSPRPLPHPLIISARDKLT